MNPGRLVDRGRPLNLGRAGLLAVALVLGALFGVMSGSGAAGATPSGEGRAEAVSAPARLAGELPVPDQDPSTSDQKADDILGRQEFQRAQPGVFQRILTWLGDEVGTVLAGLFTGGSGAAVSWAILAVVLTVVALIVFRVARTVQAEPIRSGPEMQVEVRRSPIEWRREAEACEARGEWKAALRCRYRALVADLVARRVVRDLAGHTTGEYRADVAVALPAAAAEFAGASELFERAWYGDRPTGPEENARFQELAAVVVDRAGKPVKGSAASDPDLSDELVR